MVVIDDGETGRGQDKQTDSMYSIWEKRNEPPNVEGMSLLGAATVLRLERDAWPMVK